MRIVLVAIGAVVAFIGAACAAGGTFVLTSLDSDGYLASDTGSLRSETAALVSENAELGEVPEGPGSWFDDWGSIKFRVTVSSIEEGKNVFVGVARSADVEKYLDGVEYDEIDDVDFDPLSVDLDRVQGDRVPGKPEDQKFWLATATGPGEQVLTWEIEEGDYRFVIMNVDASPVLGVNAEFAVRASAADDASWFLIIVGVILLILGILGVVFGARAIVKHEKAHSEPAPAPTASAVPAAPVIGGPAPAPVAPPPVPGAPPPQAAQPPPPPADVPPPQPPPDAGNQT